jgi:hypothetical protein
VGTDVVERRDLIMVNPAPGNTYATTRNIVAAYQDTAARHRALESGTHRLHCASCSMLVMMSTPSWTVGASI